MISGVTHIAKCVHTRSDHSWRVSARCLTLEEIKKNKKDLEGLSFNNYSGWPELGIGLSDWMRHTGTIKPHRELTRSEEPIIACNAFAIDIEEPQPILVLGGLSLEFTSCFFYKYLQDLEAAKQGESIQGLMESLTKEGFPDQFSYTYVFEQAPLYDGIDHKFHLYTPGKGLTLAT